MKRDEFREWLKNRKYSKGGLARTKCDTCGKEVIRFKSEIERSKRHFCSRECFYNSPIPDKNLAQRDNITHTSRHYAHDLALKIFPHKCQICSSEENLEVHHKDGDFRNNSPDNLILLCLSCHRRIDNRIKNIPKNKMGIKSKEIYEKNKEVIELNRLPNGRWSKWSSSP